MILLKLKLWSTAAENIVQLHSLLTNYLASEGSDERLKEAAQNQMALMISTLRELNPEQRELLYTELGDDRDAVQSLIDTPDET